MVIPFLVGGKILDYCTIKVLVLVTLLLTTKLSVCLVKAFVSYLQSWLQHKYQDPSTHIQRLR